MSYEDEPAAIPLYSRFRDLDLGNGKGYLSLEDFVGEMYEKQRIDILVCLHRNLDPYGNYLIEHDFTDWDGRDPVVDFYMSYDLEKKKKVTDDSVKNHHIYIDVDFLKQHVPKLRVIQNELSEILEAISKAFELNKKISSVYKDFTDIDAQEVFNYHDDLFNKCLENILVEDHIESIFAVDDDEEMAATESSLEERVVTRIRMQEAMEEPPKGMPAFHLAKYREMEEIKKSPHIKERIDGKVIALFAGDKTGLLVSRLQEINLQIGEPIRNKQTGVWNYTIANSSTFVGLVYRDFLEYVNEMLGGLGRIPTCGWCDQPITPTAQQLRKIKEGRKIYHKDTNCSNRGRSFNQNLKRTKRKEQDELYNQRNAKSEPANLLLYKLNNHFSGMKVLSLKEQSDIIQHQIIQDTSK